MVTRAGHFKGQFRAIEHGINVHITRCLRRYDLNEQGRDGTGGLSILLFHVILVSGQIPFARISISKVKSITSLLHRRASHVFPSIRLMYRLE